MLTNTLKILIKQPKYNITWYTIEGDPNLPATYRMKKFKWACGCNYDIYNAYDSCPLQQLKYMTKLLMFTFVYSDKLDCLAYANLW